MDRFSERAKSKEKSALGRFKDGAKSNVEFMGFGMAFGKW